MRSTSPPRSLNLSPNEPDNGSGKSKNKYKKRWVLWVFLVFISGMSYLTWAWFQSVQAYSNGFQPPEMAAAQYSDKTVRANLGGMMVVIPAHFANYVEYDGDPGFGEKRQGPTPKRTPQSTLKSFGFDVRYPDMAGLDSSEMFKDKASYKTYNTPWISVGFTTGNSYPGDGFLDRLTHGTVDTPNNILKYANYEKLSAAEYGLTVYAPKGIDPKTKKIYREDKNAEDIFIHRHNSGKIDTYIRCSNRYVQAPPCTQTFNLEPNAKSVVYVSYRRSLLPEWQSIQKNVRQLVFNFEAKEKLSMP
jgi:hypothetical protein